jgi:hypothetical protein
MAEDRTDHRMNRLLAALEPKDFGMVIHGHRARR